MVTAVRERVLVGEQTEAYGADPSSPQRYDFRYKVMELEDIITSHNDNLEANPAYPKELQPRVRDGAASRIQISTMARNLNPRMLLHDSGFLDTGPMIIGSDNVVESGNGRMLALRYAYGHEPSRYDLYKQMLLTNAAKYGVGKSGIEAFNAPVLVRERITPVDRVKFAADANVGAVMRMSPYEQALQDSGRLSGHVISNLEVGEEQTIDQALRMKSNQPIINHFVSTLPANERASVSEAGGSINQQGIERLKLAIFAKTYTGTGGQRLVRIFGENADPVIKSIENSVFQTLPDMAKAEGLISAGKRDKSLSIGEDMAEVIDTYAIAKQRNLKIKDYLAQSAMFEDKLNSDQKAMLEHLDDIAGKQKQVRAWLRDMAGKIVDAPPPGQASMLGFEGITKKEVIHGSINKQRTELGLEALHTAAYAAFGKGLEEPDAGRDKGAKGVGKEVEPRGKQAGEPAGEPSGTKGATITLAPRTSVQTGLMGMGRESAQVEMLGEFGAYASGKKQPLVDIEAEKAKQAAKPLPGQGEMFEGKQKEPWEMTANEYFKYITGKERSQWGRGVSKQVSSRAVKAHARIVESALSEGRPVPAEVLKDYPELTVEARDKYLQGKALEEHKGIIQEEIKKAGNREIGLKVAAERIERQRDADSGMPIEENIKAAKLIRKEAEQERAKGINTAEKPTPEPEKAPVAKVEKPTTPREPKSYVISLDDKRSDHAIRIDRAIEAKEVVDRRSKKGVARWRNRPNQMDIRGVDTPKRQRKPPTRAVLDRRGRYHRQKSGMVL